MNEDRSTNPAQAESLDDMLNTLIGDAFRLGQQDRWHAMPELQEQKQALLAYVARMEARQMHPDFDEMYALYLRDEKRGDPALRDVRFAGYAAAFFTRFLRIMNPDWANEEGEE